MTPKHQLPQTQSEKEEARPRFLNPSPPVPERCAIRFGRPCRTEEGSQLASGCDQFQRQACVHERECEETSLGLPLTQTYQGCLKVTMTETSSSIIVRSEHQYSRADRLRLGLRKHIHELCTSRPFSVVLTRGIVDAIGKDLQLLRGDQPQVSREVTNESPCQFLSHSTITRIVDVLMDILNGRLDSDPPGNWWSDEEEKACDEIAKELRNGVWELSPSQAKAWARQATAHIFAPMRCHDVAPTDSFGRYLGFVDLRLNSMISPLALGLLVTPRHLRHDDWVRCIEGEYSTLFGAAGFVSSVYSMHDPERGGSSCSQAAVIIATGVLSDRGAQVPGSYEATYMARGLNAGEPITIDGLNFPETLALLNKRELRTTATSFRRAVTPSWDRWLAERLIEAYVVARCPVLLFVGAKEWYGLQEEGGDPNHCVAVVGFRRKRLGEKWSPSHRSISPDFEPSLLSHLVIHDPGYRPFSLWPLDQCFYASSHYRAQSPEISNNSLNLVFVAADHIETHAYDCYKALVQNCGSLLHGNEDGFWLKRYLRGAIKGVSHWDLRFTLVHRDDIETQFFSSLGSIYAGDSDDSAFLKTELERTQSDIQGNFPNCLALGWYWAIAGYQEGRLRTLWLFNAEEKLFDSEGKLLRNQPWEWRFHVYDDGSHLRAPVAEAPGEPIRDKYVLSDIQFAQITSERPYQKLHPTQPHGGSLASKSTLEPALPALDLSRLHPSVITSSSTRSLHPLTQELMAIDRLEYLDLYVLRDQDVRDMALSKDFRLQDDKGSILPLHTASEQTSAALMAVTSNASSAAEWFFSQLTQLPRSPLIPAFATYLPQIANTKNELLRDQAVNALANIVRMGIQLQERLASHRGKQGQNGEVKDVIVEIVCGSRLDPYVADETDPPQVVEISLDTKIETILKGLGRVVTIVDDWQQKTYGDAPPCRYAIGVELEPGSTYVLKDWATLNRFVEILKQQPSNLQKHVGLNLDIAHMIMSDVHSSHLGAFGDLVVHAHIADHPGMHTRDQRISGFMPVDRFEAEEYAFLVALAEIWGGRSKQEGLPYSGCVAVELEGCGRIGWVHSSVHSLYQMCEAVSHFGAEIRKRGSRRWSQPLRWPASGGASRHSQNTAPAP